MRDFDDMFCRRSFADQSFPQAMDCLRNQFDIINETIDGTVMCLQSNRSGCVAYTRADLKALEDKIQAAAWEKEKARIEEEEKRRELQVILLREGWILPPENKTKRTE